MPTETEIEAARCVIRDEIRAFWDASATDPSTAEKMIDGYRSMAKKALEAAEKVRIGTKITWDADGNRVVTPLTE